MADPFVLVLFFSFHLVCNARVPKNEASVLVDIFPLLGN